jgi:hypothetical protein
MALGGHMSERDFGDGDFGDGTMGGPLTTTGGQPPASAKITRWQPILPEEQPPTKAERYFISQTPRIFPANQDSNWGQHRKIFTDAVQLLIDQQSLIWKERFVARADTFLDEWEFQAGIPENPPGLSVGQRRLKILNRLRSGPFTDQRRIEIIEPYILATFGVSVELGPGGVSLTGGIPLMADAGGDPRQYYRVYEDVRNFAYEVWIASGLTPDVAGMLRDLKRITPAGITATIDNSHADVLDYARLVKNYQPVYYARDNSATDFSGYGLTATTVTSVGAVASPGLLSANVAGGNGASSYNGSSSFKLIPDASQLRLSDHFTVQFLLKMTALPAAGQIMSVVYFDTDGLHICVDEHGYVQLRKAAAVQPIVISSLVGVVPGTTYLVTVRKRPGTTPGKATVHLNAVDQTNVVQLQTISDTTTGFYIGRHRSGVNWLNAQVDELQIYNYWLDDDAIVEHNKTRQDQAI